MTRSLHISNVYGHGFDEVQRARLEAAGFNLRPQTSRYAGSQVCSFIDFARGPVLELIEIEDVRQYLGFVPPGMEPYCPGISLTAAEGSAVGVTEIERELDDLDPYRLHVGYDGSDDPAAPGWNYLNFATPVTPATFTWFTAFDEPRPERSYPTTHPNGVVGVVGLVFDLQIGDLRRLAQLAGASIGENSLRIGEVDVWANVPTLVPSIVERTFPLFAIVLEAPNIDELSRAADVVEISFLAEPAVLIRTSTQSWDLVIRSATSSA